MKFAIAALLLVVMLGIVVVASYISANNSGVMMENGITASIEDSQNKLTQYSLKVREALGVTEMYSEDFERVTKSALESRYGDDGAKNVFLWVQENYPGQFDSTMYVKIQQIIQAGRKEFEISQSVTIDRVRVYRNKLDFVWSGFWLRIAGFPKNFNPHTYKPIMNSYSTETFDTGMDEGINTNRNTNKEIEQ